MTIRSVKSMQGLVLAGMLALPLPSAAQTPAPAGASAIDDARLRAPQPGEWLNHGRDFAETRHSPLDQINQGNITRLAPAWSAEVGSQGKIETTPIVANGVLYGTSTYSVVYAVDARTGALKWRWDPALVKGGIADGAARFCCGPVNRGVAYYKGRVYVGLLDGRLVALNAETGHVAWAVQTTPVGSDYSITGAPRIVKGKVVIGNGGGEYGVRGYLTAYDAETGKQAWRWYVVPGDPSLGAEDRAMEQAIRTWRGQWWKYGGGGTPWDGLSYDPENNLIFVGTGNGSPWARDHRSPGGGDNLYLSSVVALNADTGRYVWHYQTTPGDDWDYNAAQQMMLLELTIDGRLRKVLVQAPKNGFFYVLDRLTGELLSAQPYVAVNWATHIDLKTGRPVETPEARYGAKGARLSPSAVGAHHWPPMAFNPKTGLVYFPGQETSMLFQNTPTFEFEQGRWNTGTARGTAAAAASAATATPAPVAGDPATPAPTTPTPSASTRGFFVAWDPVANKERWRIDFRPSGGALSTEGQLVFVGQSTGAFQALDPATGRVLWTHSLDSGIATPVTYELDGKQYVAVMSGINGGKVYAFTLDGK